MTPAERNKIMMASLQRLSRRAEKARRSIPETIELK